ncbi:LexA family transcriptional regulator [Lacibacter luteus]|uniref:LexA family transcriptional regulator n=1 Tax=Lacibacter luteus TaxID=2508719 RepID=UPI0013E94B2A|nr:LexA family transcriptional regulator [Lacibacter luteus]
MAKNLKFLRTSREEKQHETAAGIGFTRSQYNNWELGRSNPTIKDLLKVAKYFNCTISQLVEVDLENVHLSEFQKSQKNTHDVHLNVLPSVLLNTKKANLEEAQHLLNDDGTGKVYSLGMPKVITLDTQGNENVVLVPVKARAGYLNGYSDPKFIEKLPAYRLPGMNNGTYRLFEVGGASMYPTLHDGDNVIGSYVEQLRDVRDDRIYVVVTKTDGVVVKRVLNRLETDGKLILKSDNYKHRDDYPTIVCDPQDILEIWYCVGFISRQMRPPAEMYNRLIDLEGRITLIEDQNRKKLN